MILQAVAQQSEQGHLIMGVPRAGHPLDPTHFLGNP